MHPRPKLFVSRCLGFEACRYNGAVIEDPLVAKLAGFCDVTTACPEKDTGLGVPRDPVRLARAGGGIRMIQPASGRDHTDAMTAFCAAKAAELAGTAPGSARPPEGLPAVDGAVLKSRSPSCGMKDVKVYRSTEPGAMADVGIGLFGQAVLSALGGAPVEDEGRLKNYTIREHFLSGLFARARFRAVAESGGPRELSEFQARHKLLFLAVNQASMRRLGRIAANLERHPFPAVLSEYGAELGTMFGSPAKPGGVINTALHAFGGFSERLSPLERKYFLDAVEEYRDERIPASALFTLLKAWAVRFEVRYLLDQVFLDPFPKELVEITDSGKGRDR
ncbi:MAG TPA: DUF523 and DUF1722 domain-containing protein [Spirochaetia bacterium]|nr:DUF523 and DUF1722 domain-containing protein [Spirochaetales bacterium]HRY79064.1 DUF523 and DUF1722 domain-containing protein [Spirochaetia bacterium]HRZ89129.1 DUF523 and DUF1722 domain-containing protein [Spirochaetia bacterium]